MGVALGAVTVELLSPTARRTERLSRHALWPSAPRCRIAIISVGTRFRPNSGAVQHERGGVETGSGPSHEEPKHDVAGRHRRSCNFLRAILVGDRGERSRQRRRRWWRWARRRWPFLRRGPLQRVAL